MLKEYIQNSLNEIYSLREYKKEFIHSIDSIKTNENLEEIIDFALYNNKFFIKPSQIRSEIAGLLKILKESKPKYILEIGTYAGATLFLYSQVVAENAQIISVDLPGGSHGGGYPEWKKPIFKAFAPPTRRITLIRDDSHRYATLKKVKRILNNNKLDFLFIDGDHTYQGVKKDFRLYNDLVKDNGLIAFHDIVPHPPESNCEVNKFWNEIKNKFVSNELVEDWNQNWGGIGIIVKKRI
ncbi:MAG: class I SAM-dependent methyltransferase [Candidatus Lokiarchaeota archaeon]|nr:class I SAM-dependent methyltransferase [Candidatus Lokiarchaeota archaeon]